MSSHGAGPPALQTNGSEAGRITDAHGLRRPIGLERDQQMEYVQAPGPYFVMSNCPIRPLLVRPLTPSVTFSGWPRSRIQSLYASRNI